LSTCAANRPFGWARGSIVDLRSEEAVPAAQDIV
jgi:hypothetical protein